MSEPIAAAPKPATYTPEVTPVGTLNVMCDGPVFSRHPRVYLAMVDDTRGRPTQVVCPYCSHIFKYDDRLAGPEAHGH